LYYFKVHGSSERDDLVGEWGDCTWFEEVDDRLQTRRQLEVYENGNVLMYDEEHFKDQYGCLMYERQTWLVDPGFIGNENYTYQPLTGEEFEREWSSHTPINR